MKAYENLGHLYFESNNPEKAIAYFKKTVELDPTNKRGYFNLGVLSDQL